MRSSAEVCIRPRLAATQADRLSDLLDIPDSLNKHSNQEALSGQIPARRQTQAQEPTDIPGRIEERWPEAEVGKERKKSIQIAQSSHSD